MRASRCSLPLIELLALTMIAASGCGDDPTRVTHTESVPDPAPFVMTIGSAGHDEVHDVAVDPSGNVFVTGSFNEVVKFPGTTFDPAQGHVFLAKFDPTGEFVWVKHIPGVFGDGPLQLGTDDSGDVILQSGFATSVTLDYITVTSQGGGEHVIVARFTGSGAVKWISYDTGTYMSVGFGMDTGSGGGTAVTGFMQIGAKFDDTELTVPGFDFFLVRYDAGGNASWAKQQDPTGTGDRAEGGRVAIDPQGNVFVAGHFYKTFILDGVELTADATDSFIASYNRAGTLQWLRSLGDNTAESIDAIATDQDGDVYVAVRDVTKRLLKLNSDGDVLWEAPGAPAQDMAVDLDKNILQSGRFRGTLTLGENEATSNGFSDFFVARFNASGQNTFLVTGGSASEESANGLAVDRFGAAFTVVDFKESFEFGGETITTEGAQDILIMRLE